MQDIKVGDVVLFNSGWTSPQWGAYEVTRAGKKTISLKPTEGNVRGWKHERVSNDSVFAFTDEKLATLTRLVEELAQIQETASDLRQKISRIAADRSELE